MGTLGSTASEIRSLQCTIRTRQVVTPSAAALLGLIGSSIGSNLNSPSKSPSGDRVTMLNSCVYVSPHIGC